MGCIQIVNWQKFQHYKGRNPPWIKLHRQLLENREWHNLSGDASKLLAECWLLASEHEGGAIPLATADLCWRLRRTDVLATVALLQELAAVGFIELREHDASAPLAPRKQGATPEAEEERETENITVASATGALPRVEAPTKKEANAILAPLIRKHLWGGNEPPPAVLHKYPSWSMGNDIDICHALMKKAPCTLDDLATVLPVCRSVLGFEPDEPLCMALFNKDGRLDRLHECLDYLRKRREREAASKPPGPGRIAVSVGVAA